MAKEKKAIMEDVQVAAFKLLKEEYGVNILNVQEIKVLTDITRVPFAPDYIKGVINLRGSVLPVIDLKRRIGLEDAPYTDATRIIIMKIGEFSIGMIVDAVTEVLTISGRDINPAKDVSDSTSNRFVNSIGNIDARLIIMLNLDEIVDLPEDMK
ncbi:chemotaxis protein CheW [Selenomonas sputigena]|jgi:chemotaxis protein cheW|uniref:CheW protein n=1 Tax=Selenomonas sputigena (strain ATCC 35185 / DSM 20758 / CCUG 44933 / VPI D19B-28) TaxID=546271 RepID=C9LSR2_SELS3|nr:chemotaxis protein CheW [Selenomonas sputigena]AEC00632.1 CheW protein [Selenomonas sputigena ATCC 35185]EEX78011.1 CheW-like protein [Selenomonas sputigena ATCC 35185]UZD43185.1 chemotaxis protein CheW [Selenomonas sputigena]